MNDKRLYTAVGLMSGTSLDGIDAAVIRTDGRTYAEPEGFVTLPCDPDLQAILRRMLGTRPDSGDAGAVEKDLTLAQIDAVREVLADSGVAEGDVDVIGFHGQTLTHDPENGFTWQLGDGALMARTFGIDVVYDFRANDMAHGGQGAPLLPLYHRARLAACACDFPAAVLNIGGVANITWIGGADGDAEDTLMAFDTGPGNALLDDFASRRRGMDCDRGGALAAQGGIRQGPLLDWLSHPYFSKRPPKSLDRNAFMPGGLDSLSDEDGAATLAAFTVYAVEKALAFLPAPPRNVYVSGGGRHNPALMKGLAAIPDVNVAPVETLGWNGDAIEAEGMAFLAVRSLMGLPLSYPATTGVRHPVSGGRLART